MDPLENCKAGKAGETVIKFFRPVQKIKYEKNKQLPSFIDMRFEYDGATTLSKAFAGSKRLLVHDNDPGYTELCKMGT